MRYGFSGIYALVFCRTYLVAAAYNKRGLQNVGFMYAIDPALADIHKDQDALRQARGRYVRHFNCHPFWTPLLAGVFLRTEQEIAKSALAPDSFTAIKDTATNTLSAIGDSVFGGTLMVTWSLICAFLILGGHPGMAVALSLAAVFALQVFKLSTYAAGLRYGLGTFFWLRKWDLINWGDRFKLLNAVLLLVLLAQCIPGSSAFPDWIRALPCAILAAWLTARTHVPRSLLALAGTVAMLYFW